MTTTYPINDIYTCIQGEGVQTGVAMVLVRLHGCAVGCPWCDTKETWEFEADAAKTAIADVLGANPQYAWRSAADIADYVVANHAGPKWILLTGGEPAQYDLAELVAAFHAAGYQVALETSGTERGHLNAPIDWVCVSPKFDMPGGKTVLNDTLAQAHEIKQVVGKQADIDRLDGVLAELDLSAAAQICLQPVSTSAKATELCIETVQARGWRLSVQTHKYLGVD